MDASWLVDAIGFMAGTLTTASFLPQAIKTLRTKATRDISLIMWIMLSAGVAVWIVYGYMTDSMPLMVTNGITLALTGTILVLKIRNLSSE